MPDFFLDGNKSAPSVDAAAVTTSDSADLPVIPTRGLYVGAAGDVKVIMASGATVTFADVLAGTVLPIQVRRVFATGTVATDIVALY